MKKYMQRKKLLHILSWDSPSPVFTGSRSRLLYNSNTIWVLRTQNAGWNLHYSIFLKLKKHKKVTNLVPNLAKNCFLSLHQNASQVFYSHLTKNCSSTPPSHSPVDPLLQPVILSTQLSDKCKQPRTCNMCCEFMQIYFIWWIRTYIDSSCSVDRISGGLVIQIK